jgi:hypothetical protein
VVAVDLQRARAVGSHLHEGQIVSRHQVVALQIEQHVVVQLDILEEACQPAAVSGIHRGHRHQ